MFVLNRVCNVISNLKVVKMDTDLRFQLDLVLKLYLPVPAI